ncbi:MAG: large conductance mechanosensitive channel protein MscL [Clostridia bacterium]|nr:large conductance mechanosensitive channel protein MscL [Clostridia bacterium]
MAKFLKDFKEFAFKGNIVDLAVGVMIGGAFGKITTSFVNDMVMPLISLFTGGTNFADLFVALDGNTYATLAAAEEAGAACFKYGAFIQTVLDFFIIAFFVFLMVKAIAKMRKPEPVVEVKEARLCPYCKQEIADDATRCHHCTSELEQ